MPVTDAPSSRRGTAKPIVSFVELIDLWPRYIDLATDCGVPLQTVVSWRKRENIPMQYWESIEASAQKRNIHGVTYDYLRAIAAVHSPRARRIARTSDVTPHRPLFK